MGLTVTRVTKPASIGDKFVTVSTVDFDSSYPTGGEALSATDLGFASTSDPEFEVRIDPKSGFTFEYDYTSGKLLAYGTVRAITGTIDHASINAVTARDDAVTATGVVSTDICIGFQSPPALEAKAIAKSARVTGTDQVTVRLENSSAASIDPASGVYTFYLVSANGAAKEIANTTDLSALTGVRVRAVGRFRQ